MTETHPVPVPIRADEPPQTVTATFSDTTVTYSDPVEYRPRTPTRPALALYATREVADR